MSVGDVAVLGGGGGGGDGIVGGGGGGGVGDGNIFRVLQIPLEEFVYPGRISVAVVAFGSERAAVGVDLLVRDGSHGKRGLFGDRKLPRLFGSFCG